MSAYYNEIEPYAAQWLRNLIKEGLIPDGEVDTRSIVDVAPDDLRGFTQCHFFAGIGGWSHALRLAGWPDDRPIWTGSCPCQPFSVAGKGAGTDDPRHLWPHFHRLITAVRPPVVMGEQVAGAAGYGWLDGVRADLAREGYASRGVDIPACSVDAPHIRQRLYWVATDLADTGHMRGWNRTQSGEPKFSAPSGLGSAVATMDDAAGEGLEGFGYAGSVAEGSVRQTGIVVGSEGCGSGDMADARYDESQGWIAGQDTSAGASAGNSTWNEPASCRISHGNSHMADANHERRDRIDPLLRQDEAGRVKGDLHEAAGHGSGHMADADDAKRRQNGARGDDNHRDQAGRGQDAGDVGACYPSFWSNAVWLTGADGKSRRSQPGLPLLAHGIPNRVGRLRAYGNAIVPPLAAEVIKAFMECEA